MKLAEWMIKNGLRDEILALQLGVHRVTVSRLRRDKITPSFALASRIFELTKGTVPPTSFVPPAWDGFVSEADIDRECAG